MTLSADTHGDLLRILGRDGVTVSEVGADTLHVDIDLATNSGLEVVGQKLKMKVDGSTVTINGSGQLVASPPGASVLEDLTDVSYGVGEPNANQVLFWSGSTWTPGNVSLGGTATSFPNFGDTETVITSLSKQNRSVASATHVHGSREGIATDTHVHAFFLEGVIDDQTGGPLGASDVIGVNSISATFNRLDAVTNIGETSTSVRGNNHTHGTGSLSLSLT